MKTLLRTSIAILVIIMMVAISMATVVMVAIAQEINNFGQEPMEFELPSGEIITIPQGTPIVRGTPLFDEEIFKENPQIKEAVIKFTEIEDVILLKDGSTYYIHDSKGYLYRTNISGVVTFVAGYEEKERKQKRKFYLNMAVAIICGIVGFFLSHLIDKIRDKTPKRS